MNKTIQFDIFESLSNEETKRIQKENTIKRLRYLKNWMDNDMDIDITAVDEICNLENILHYEFLMNWDDIESYTS